MAVTRSLTYLDSWLSYLIESRIFDLTFYEKNSVKYCTSLKTLNCSSRGFKIRDKGNGLNLSKKWGLEPKHKKGAKWLLKKLKQVLICLSNYGFMRNTFFTYLVEELGERTKVQQFCQGCKITLLRWWKRFICL